MNEMDGTYYLINTYSGKRNLLQIFYKRGLVLYRLFSRIEEEEGAIEYSLNGDKSSSMPLVEGKNLLEEILNKDEIYSNSDGLEEYFLLEKHDEPLEQNHSRCYRPYVNSIIGTTWPVNPLINKIKNGDLDIRNYNIDLIVLIDSLNQYQILIDEMNLIFKYVEPSIENFLTYGSKIRNLLILTCTEIEAQWRGIYNTKFESKDRLNTNDYYRTNELMKLHEYKIEFTNYPLLSVFAPFENWTSSDPTKSLEWYNAYNKVKHDRYSQFKRGCLDHCMNALSALTILLIAQYGPYNGMLKSNFRGVVNLIEEPSWTIEEHLVPAIRITDYQKEIYKLSPQEK
jgi:hypothetical protein